jgi:hypothetical protein
MVVWGWVSLLAFRFRWTSPHRPGFFKLADFFSMDVNLISMVTEAQWQWPGCHCGDLVASVVSSGWAGPSTVTVAPRH